jgi:hypothetical protein
MIFQEELMKNKRQQTMMTLLMVGALICALSFILRSFASKMWLDKKDSVACVPTEIDNSLPMVYYQSSYHPVQEDTKLKQFILEYTRLTKNESYINQHNIKGTRYDDLMLSKNLLAAIELSFGAEKAVNERRFKDSAEQLKFLKENKMGFEFLVKGLVIQSIPGSGTARIEVRGRHQAIFDNAQKDTPIRFLGEKQIVYIVTMGEEVIKEGATKNKYGFYVVDSFETNLSPSESLLLDQVSRAQFTEKLRGE